MEPNLVDCVVHWKKKLDKNPDNEDIILNVIRKLSKIKMTFEILQTTQIGKNIRNLSKRNDDVGEKAKALLIKWKTIVNLESSKSSKHHKSHKNNVEDCSIRIDSITAETGFHHARDSSLKQKEKHREKSSHHSSSKLSSDKPLKESGSSKSSKPLDESKMKKSHLNDKDFDYNFKTLYSDDKNVDEKIPNSNQLHTSSSSSSKRKLTSEEQSEAWGSSLPKKHKSEKYSRSSTEEKKKHSVTENNKEHKKQKCDIKYEGSKSAKQSSSLHGKKAKKDDSKIKNDSFHPAKSEPVLNFPSSEEFTAQSASFEDCLGFNDSVTVKKKKSSKSHSSAKKTPDSVHAKRHLGDEVGSDSSECNIHVSTKSSSADSSKGKQFGSTLKTPTVIDNSKASPLFLSSMQSKSFPNPGFHGSKKDVLSNEDVMKFTSSRNKKTAIYSGRRNNNKTIPTLAQCCYRFLIENVDILGPLGDAPYTLLKPILEKCTSEQLFTIEKYNPYLLDDTNELWEIHCKRDYKLLSPLEHETWRDVYLRGFDEREERLKNITSNISASMQKATPVRRAKLVYMNASATVKPPREVLRRQVKHGLLGSDGSGSQPGYSSKAVAKKLSLISAPSTSNRNLGDDKKDAVKKNEESSLLNAKLPSKQSTALPPVDIFSADKDTTNMSRAQKKPKTVPPLMAKVLKTAKQCFRR